MSLQQQEATGARPQLARGNEHRSQPLLLLFLLVDGDDSDRPREKGNKRLVMRSRTSHHGRQQGTGTGLKLAHSSSHQAYRLLRLLMEDK